jgi:hypothetical protein
VPGVTTVEATGTNHVRLLAPPDVRPDAAGCRLPPGWAPRLRDSEAGRPRQRSSPSQPIDRTLRLGTLDMSGRSRHTISNTSRDGTLSLADVDPAQGTRGVGTSS